jgi:hypothetical protein
VLVHGSEARQNIGPNNGPTYTKGRTEGVSFIVRGASNADSKNLVRAREFAVFFAFFLISAMTQKFSLLQAATAGLSFGITTVC